MKEGLPETIVINLQQNFSNETAENLTFFNKIISSIFLEKMGQHLDIDKCRIFLKNYQDEIENIKEDYYQGF